MPDSLAIKNKYIYTKFLFILVITINLILQYLIVIITIINKLIVFHINHKNLIVLCHHRIISIDKSYDDH
jgi:hypothetical protein